MLPSLIGLSSQALNKRHKLEAYCEHVHVSIVTFYERVPLNNLWCQNLCSLSCYIGTSYTRCVPHCLLTIGASHLLITPYYRDLDILEIKLFHEAYNMIKDMLWHCQPLWWMLVSSPNTSMIKNSPLFDINLFIWCVRLYVGHSRRKSQAAASAIANVVPKCLTWEDTSSNASIHCLLNTQRTTTGDTHKNSRKFLRILEALTAHRSVPWYHLEMRTLAGRGWFTSVWWYNCRRRILWIN